MLEMTTLLSAYSVLDITGGGQRRYETTRAGALLRILRSLTPQTPFPATAYLICHNSAALKLL
jgi:hypothetical protein